MGWNIRIADEAKEDYNLVNCTITKEKLYSLLKKGKDVDAYMDEIENHGIWL
jgi:hypothetical protein